MEVIPGWNSSETPVDIFVTDKMRKLADGKDVEVNVTIDEDEYQKACIELIQGTQGDPASLCLT